ncbi:LysR family transcriptional regulator [Rhodoferax saidenbachensis]|uniref:LysR family transcriptional regulator n=1 Tax=Rhodoferax saidenbachensis TaxID=1484693 RepID=A0A1P8KDD2_9BURK|nr:LysR family transcriptional regulator [Rhodoferax saidenbachensis]APW43966.1 LysR family transcriptional regulator [Rhodoferax saidenbachensis]
MDRLMSMRVFQRVIDEGSFAGAARALDMSPAVVTRLVADLEDHLGTRLLHRSTRRLSLSDAGETYLSRVRAILQDIDEAHLLASSQTHEHAGVLHILATPLLATHILAPLLVGFRERYPKILLDVAVEDYKEPPVEDYDITLMGEDTNYDGDVIARKIVSTEAVLLASPDYLKRRGTPQTPEDLAQHDCLHHKVLGVRPRAWCLFQADHPNEYRDVAVDSVVWSNHGDTLLRATLDGGGIAAMSVDLTAAYLSSGALVRVLRPWITGQYALYAALPSRKFMPQRTRVFLEYLTERTRAKISTALGVCGDC